jgi:hypothetical protein
MDDGKINVLQSSEFRLRNTTSTYGKTVDCYFVPVKETVRIFLTMKSFYVHYRNFTQGLYTSRGLYSFRSLLLPVVLLLFVP